MAIQTWVLTAFSEVPKNALLLGPFEEKLHFPSGAVEFGDGQRRQAEVVGEEDQPLVVLGVVELHPAQWVGVAVAAFGGGQPDGLVAAQAGRLVHRARIDPPELQVRLGPHDEEGLRLVQGVEPGEVDAAPVQTNKASRLEGDPVGSPRGACPP